MNEFMIYWLGVLGWRSVEWSGVVCRCLWGVGFVVGLLRVYC